jgi:hypothetical protein
LFFGQHAPVFRGGPLQQATVVAGSQQMQVLPV